MEYCNLQRLNADLKHYICGQSSLFLLLNISKEILHFFSFMLLIFQQENITLKYCTTFHLSKFQIPM